MPLTVQKIRAIKTPGKYYDGKNLLLLVKASGSASWVCKYQFQGKKHEIGLGSLKLVSLTEARQKALDCAKACYQGLNPLTIKRQKPAHQKSVTFREAAAQYIAAHCPGWRNAKHREQWPNSFDLHAFPLLGDMPVHEIGTEHVVEVLGKIWTQHPETGSRLRGRIEAVIDWAKVRGYSKGENPARWAGHLKSQFPSKYKVRAIRHFKAMAQNELPGFFAELGADGLPSATALQFLILTAARTTEVRGANWAEIDWRSQTWIVPAERIKAGREHRVPLCDTALKILLEAEKHSTGPLIFGLEPGNKLASENYFLQVLKRLKRKDVTVHGFRATFRTWAAECTHHQREVAEMALAHANGDKVEASYQHGDLFNKRMRLMSDWENFCLSPTMASGENILTFPVPALDANNLLSRNA